MIQFVGVFEQVTYAQETATITTEPAYERPQRLFGHYRLHLGVAQPTFNAMEHYKDFYGATDPGPFMQFDVFAFDWFVTVGGMFRMGYFSDRGSAIKTNSTDGTIEKDSNAPLSLTVVPLQFAATFEGTPFNRKWIVFSGWVGMEYSYFEEVRVNPDVDSSTSTTTSQKKTFFMAPTPTQKAAKTEEPTYVNRGWKSGQVVGAAMSFRIDQFDERAANSLSDTIGFNAIYLSPFIEVVRSPASGVSFGRNTIGMAFTFESAR